MSKVIQTSANGLYGVLLHDRQNCTDAEIKSLVSQFGKIKNYKRIPRGNDPDWVFVHFETYEEALQCLQRLEKDPMFYASAALPQGARGRSNQKHSFKSRNSDVFSQEEGRAKSIGSSRRYETNNTTFEPRSRSVVTSKADEDEEKTIAKDVRFVKPGESSPTPLRKQSYFDSSYNSLGDLSSGNDFSDPDDRPPYLLNMIDIWIEKFTEQAGIPTSIEVIVYNLPVNITEGSVFAVCSSFINVLAVEIVEIKIDNNSIYAAFIQVRSPDDAKTLKKLIHQRVLMGKVLKVVFSSSFK